MVRVEEPTLRSEPPARRRSRPARSVLIGIVLAVVVLVAALVVMLGANGPPGTPPASLGVAQDRVIPASVLSLPLIDQDGRATSLDALGGKIVVLTPFMTSCQETCPITTGAFLQMRQDVRAAGLGSAVRFAEISIDPARDLPSRMAAYAKLTGANWPLLTGTAADLDALWKYFGVFHQKVPEDNPPGLDWETGRPYTYDVNHSDGFIVLDARSHERFATGAAPRLAPSNLERPLTSMLSAQGRSDLDHPAASAWTVPQGLEVIGWVAGRAVPARS
jgi:protein SCO1/2